MERLLKEKDMYMKSFNRYYDEIDRELKTSKPNIIDIQGTMRSLTGTFELLSQNSTKIFDTMLDDDAYNDKIDDIKTIFDDITKQFYTLQVKVDIYSNETQSDVSNTNRRRHLKLPTIEFKKFSGEIKDWLAFWSQFSRIHEDDEIENEDKFNYLIQATVQKSKARQLIESYPCSSGNYEKVVESLKSRFGRKDLLVEFYVRELLKLVLNNLQEKPKLNVLYDNMSTQIRALETLGVTTETCAAILYPLVESCLPEDLLRVWQRSDVFAIENSLQDQLENIMRFLKREVENEERISLATSGFGLLRTRKHEIHSQTNSVPTASGMINQNRQYCIFCKKDHANDKCEEAAKMTFAERKKISSSKGCCHICLKFGHIARKCRSANKLECNRCKGKHVTLMCPSEENIRETQFSIENLSNQTCNQVFLQTLVVNLQGNNITSRKVRVLFDTGSQRSYILKKTATELGYQSIREEELVHGLFGGYQSDVVSHLCYRIKLNNVDNTYTCSLEALDQNVICGSITSFQKDSWKSELNCYGVTISDIPDSPIEILLGVDVCGRLFTGKQYVLNCGLVALETKLGWTLMGKIISKQNTFSSLTTTSLHCKDIPISDLWKLDVIGISDPAIERTRKETEEAVKDYFIQTLTRSDDGRYEVSLPWISGHFPLPRNFYLAQKRLENVKKKIVRNGYLNDYHQVFKDWIDEKIIEEVPVEEINLESHYLPHHPVVKLSSVTTKIRPVFDASAKQNSSSPSLNQCLEKGLNLIELIPSMLIRFRLKRIGVIADIRKAFLQISVLAHDRNFLRFLWYDDHDQIVHYRHTRVVFGATCSPFLLGAVIEYHLKQALENSKYTRTIIKQLMRSFYVDNCVTSFDDDDDLRNFIKETTNVMADGQFDLRLWEYTRDCSDNDEMTSVLGLMWNKYLDTLRLCLEKASSQSFEKVTKKVILSAANRIFDPIGVICPVLLCPKLLLQKTCLLNLNWNTEVPTDISIEFKRWFEEISKLEFVEIPRWLLQSDLVNLEDKSVHLFCDASQHAYAAAIFIRTTSATRIKIQLVQAKSRVSPVKKMSICRLELLAATIGARLLNSVMNELNQEIKDISTYCWTDSTTTLAWIKRTENWKPFVRNRTEEIKMLTNVDDWYYVPGELNPADLPSRGSSPSRLLQSKWWEGPTWLSKPANVWPSQNYQENQDCIAIEKQKTIIGLVSHDKIDISWLYTYFSKYKQIISMVCWMQRFINNCKNSRNRTTGKFSLEEHENAEKTTIKLVQREAFSGLDDKQFGSLILFKDNEGILRVKTRIVEREDTKNFRFPMLLPSKHIVVRRLVYDYHINLCHAGSQILLSNLREKFWIIGGRKSIRSVITKCVRCRRYDTKHLETPPVTLPSDRVRDAAVFEVTGLDMTGPLYVRDKSKVWICIFTCAIYRAVHLELVSSLTTECFLQALRRFVARRGRPSVLYSDNGTNFIGAENLFKDLDWEKIENSTSVERIKWKFNPPTAAWWGGWWERLIRTLKGLLRKVLGRAALNVEELSTLVCDCEAIINSRPITYISENNSDLTSLTPSMFLQDIKEVGVPDLDSIELTDLRKRFRYRVRLRNDLRNRFRSEYLGSLVLRSSKSQAYEIHKGDVVMVGSDNTKRLDWPLAKVQELILGKDGQIRLVRLKTKDGFLLRPIQRIFPLEVHSNVESDILKKKLSEVVQMEIEKNNSYQNSSESTFTTRSGRKIKHPERLGY